MAGSHQAVRCRAVGGSRFDIFADGTRWRLLRILRSHAGWLTEGRLAAKLTPVSSGRDGGTADGRRLRTQLRHTHLPKLADRELVAWDAAEGVVRRTESTATVVDQFGELMEIVAETPDLSAGVVADERRREVLDILDAEPEPISRTHLSHELAKHAGDGEQTVRDVSISLHHHHLPKLEEAGLLDYDTDAETVTYCGPPALPTALAEL